MAFAKGQSGNPGGRSNEKIWRDALRMALKEATSDGMPRIRALAEKTVSLALEGDMQAIKEIGDRMDGKPAQAITGDGENGAININIMRFTDGH
jgi:hypothetical protein